MTTLLIATSVIVSSMCAVRATPLQWDGRLASAANEKAVAIASSDIVSHVEPSGRRIGRLVEDSGFHCKFCGENIAVLPALLTEPIDALRAWMLSPKHRELMLDGRFNRVGCSTVLDSFRGFDMKITVCEFGTE